MVVAKWHVRRTSGAPKALAVALSFCRLLGLGCPKQAFAKIATPRKSKNEETLKKISGEANVYAIFTALKDANEYSLRYIGQTKSKLARTRLTNHLISKHEKTGAKLSKVTDHIQSGGSIKISWISVNPESLRHYVEERLIEEHSECDWNKQGKKT